MRFVCIFLASDEWKLSSSADTNGNAQPSPLAAKGYRSVHPSLSADKPQVGVCTQTGRRLVDCVCSQVWQCSQDPDSDLLWNSFFRRRVGGQ